MRAQDTRNPNNYLRVQKLNQHLGALENITPAVDTKAPLVSKRRFHNFFQTNTALMQQQRITLDNAKLLAQLAQIYNGNIKVRR